MVVRIGLLRNCHLNKEVTRGDGESNPEEKTKGQKGQSIQDSNLESAWGV